MNALTKAQIITQLTDFIIATLRSATNNPSKRWAYFQEIRGVLRYALSLDDAIYLQVLEEVYLQADRDPNELISHYWAAYNA